MQTKNSHFHKITPSYLFVMTTLLQSLSILQEDFSTRFMSCNNKELIQGAEEFLNSLQENYILSLFGFLSSLLEAHSTWFLPCTNRYVEEFLIFLQYYLYVRLLIFLWDGTICSNISLDCRQLSQH